MTNAQLGGEPRNLDVLEVGGNCRKYVEHGRRKERGVKNEEEGARIRRRGVPSG